MMTTERYYLKADYQTEWNEVTREQFIAAEQAAGFRSKFGPNHPATGGFTGRGMRGRVEHPRPEQAGGETAEFERNYYADYQRQRMAKYPARVLVDLVAAGEINREQYERLRRESVEPEHDDAPAAPERSERWRISTVKNDVYVAGSKVNATEIYVDDGRTDWCAQVLRPERAKQIVNTMNQHSTLTEQREQLVEVLRLIQGFNWQLDDSPHGLEIKRRAELVLTTIEQE